MKKIYILGVPAAGKTYLGSKLAQQEQFFFYDLNQELAKQLGVAPEYAVAACGEEKYRAAEKNLVEKLFSASESAGGEVFPSEAFLPPYRGIICALSGGCFEQKSLRELAGKYFSKQQPEAAKLLILRASLETIAPRIGLNSPRPAALGTPRFWLREMLKQREENWKELPATWIDTDNKTVEEILDCLRAQL